MLSIASLLIALSAHVASASAVDDTLFDICKSSYEAFEAKAAVKSCGAAADAPSLPVARRVNALRYLAQAHVLAGDDARAIETFTRMLVLDDAALVAPEAGPRERDAFARARRALDDKGAVRVVDPGVGMSDGATVRVSVVDPFHRVAGARVRARDGAHVRTASLEVARDGDVLTLQGLLPVLAHANARDVHFDVVLLGHTGAPLVIDAALAGVHRQAPDAVPSSSSSSSTASGDDGAPAPAPAPSDGTSTLHDVGLVVLASGVVGEVCWLASAIPVVAVNQPDLTPVVVVGGVAFGGMMATGGALMLLSE